MKSNLIKVVALLALLASPFIGGQAIAAGNSLADAKIVLQISDPNPFKQKLVLNVANNIIKHYGQDSVELEIVAFGPGLRLLFADNANKGRVNSLAGRGVRFSACANTTRNMSKMLGQPVVLSSKAVTVSAGVVRIIDLVKKGYTLVKP